MAFGVTGEQGVKAQKAYRLLMAYRDGNGRPVKGGLN
jgi:hypothetical protein